MTSITINELAPIVYKLAKEAIEKDHDHWYGLQGPVDYGRIKTSRFPAFNYQDDFLLVEKVNEDTSHWWLKSFDPESKIWDGTSNLPDKGCKSLDALFRASVFHDVGYARVEAISKATGIPVKDLLAFFDDCLKLLAEGYGAKKAVTGPVYHALRFGGSLYHKLMKLFGILVFAIFFVTGCYAVKTQLLDEPPQYIFTGPFTQEQLNEQYETQD